MTTKEVAWVAGEQVTISDYPGRNRMLKYFDNTDGIYLSPKPVVRQRDKRFQYMYVEQCRSESRDVL